MRSGIRLQRLGLVIVLGGCVCSSLSTKLPGEVCGNGVDDDGDHNVDCADDECFQACLMECVDLCAASEGDRCTDDGHPAHCQRLANGCAELVSVTGCPFDRLCSSGACVDAGACIDACSSGTTRCSLAGLEESC